jgi:two-component system OmpR family response regulator
MRPNSKILIVEDDRGIINTLKPFLSDNGFIVDVVSRVAEISAAMLRSSPDLLLLDRKLPDGDGLDVIRRIRNSHQTRIILLTGIDDPIDKVVGLELGADDYITKPFHMREFLARIRAVLRRDQPGERESGPESMEIPASVRFGNWRYRFSSGALCTLTGEYIHLTGAEQRLLGYLIQHAGQVVSKDALYTMVSSRSLAPDNRSIEVLISSLRKKLRDDPQQPAIIKTVRAMGYCFIGTLESH